MKRYVTYIRVSTAEQGKSSLGLDAQKRDISVFLDNFTETPFEVLGAFREVQTGKDDNRPQLAKALALVRKTGAELLVSKLDRLSRDVAFIATIMKDTKVKLRVASMPNADNFQLHIYAALAEQERKFISARTKAALAPMKKDALEPGEKCKLGGLRDATGKRNAAVQANAKERAEKVAGIIQPLRDAGKPLREIALHLTRAGVQTARGGEWQASQVKRMLDRLDARQTSDAALS